MEIIEEKIEEFAEYDMSPDRYKYRMVFIPEKGRIDVKRFTSIGWILFSIKSIFSKKK